MLPLLPALVIVVALLLYAGLILNAGWARDRCGVKAPAVTGPPEFERAFRIQQNTIEQLVLFIPSLWLFSLFVSPLWGALLGVVWIAGRVIYAIAYTNDPERRRTGFLIGLGASLILLVGALIGTVAMLVRTSVI